MRVRILFFGILKDLAGKSSDTLEMTEGSSVRELLSLCSAQLPKLRESLPSIAVAVNQEYAGPETALKSGDEVALLPPVSGGSEKSDAATESSSGRQVLIVRDAIDTSDVLNRIKRGEDGAAVVFEGGGSQSDFGAARRFIWTTRPTRRWLCSRWKVLPSR